MSNERSRQPASPEDEFLARLGQVAPIAEDVEQAHLAAALTAVREAVTAPVSTGRRAQRPIPLWRKPRMALSNALAALAALSVPAKAAAATAAAAVAIGGGVAVTGTAPEDPPADTPAAEALNDAAENTGFELPARGEPSRDEDVEATADDDVEAQDEHENNGLNDEVLAEDPENRSDVGKARAAENRAAADERAAEARAAAEEAEARQEAAAERRADADARADAEARRSQAGDDAGTATDDEVETDEVDETEDQSSTGSDRSGAGRANADGAGRR